MKQSTCTSPRAAWWKYAAVLSVALHLPSVGVTAPKEYGNVVVDEVTSIYDADTFTVNIHGWPSIVGERISVRVKGIDAPEIRGKCRAEIVRARLAKEFTVAQLRAAQRIELRNLGRDKYFRILADVYVDGRDLAQQLVQRDFARLYDGGRKSSWCD